MPYINTFKPLFYQENEILQFENSNLNSNNSKKVKDNVFLFENFYFLLENRSVSM